MRAREILKLHNRQWASQKPKKEKQPADTKQQAVDAIEKLVKKG